MRGESHRCVYGEHTVRGVPLSEECLAGRHRPAPGNPRRCVDCNAWPLGGEVSPTPSSADAEVEAAEYERAKSLQESLADIGGYEAAAVLVPPGSERPALSSPPSALEDASRWDRCGNWGCAHWRKRHGPRGCEGELDASQACDCPAFEEPELSAALPVRGEAPHVHTQECYEERPSGDGGALRVCAKWTPEELAALKDSSPEPEESLGPNNCLTCPAREVALNLQGQCAECVRKAVPAEVLVCTGCFRVAHAYCGGKEGDVHEGCSSDGQWKRWPLVDGRPAQPVPLRRALVLLSGTLAVAVGLARDAAYSARLFAPTALSTTPEALRVVARDVDRLFRLVAAVEEHPAISELGTAGTVGSDAPGPEESTPPSYVARWLALESRVAAERAELESSSGEPAPLGAHNYWGFLVEAEGKRDDGRPMPRFSELRGAEQDAWEYGALAVLRGASDEDLAWARSERERGEAAAAPAEPGVAVASQESVVELVRRAIHVAETHLGVCRDLLEVRPGDEQWARNAGKLEAVLAALRAVPLGPPAAEEAGPSAISPAESEPATPWRHERLRVVLADVADGMRWLLDLLNVAATYAREDEPAVALGLREDLDQLSEETAENLRLLHTMLESWRAANHVSVEDLRALRSRMGRPGVLAARRQPWQLSQAEPDARSHSIPVVLLHASHLTLLAAGFNQALPQMVRRSSSARTRRSEVILERIAARTLRDGRTLAALAQVLGLPEEAPIPAEFEDFRYALTPVEPERDADGVPCPDEHPRGFEVHLEVVSEDEARAAELRPRVKAAGWDLVGREGTHWLAVRRFGEDEGATAEVRVEDGAALLRDIATVNETAAAWLALAQLSESEAAAYLRPRVEALGWRLEGYEGGRWCALNPETGVRVRHPDGLILLELLTAIRRGEAGGGHE